ncbi:hypothetical protein NCS52_01240200 [Fusarium sp. LHS14.1]|nr:hypothetical protein NCS52_01589000 [Fusarium sp. LHS14.1]KAI8710278.1 hypothetical protein NCS52_01589200 [Fusarium sp. LHS14.1]KAI8712972.1 hypothetical protein NCS52_01240200 [Fusarium sp. LHS14.1]
MAYYSSTRRYGQYPYRRSYKAKRYTSRRRTYSSKKRSSGTKRVKGRMTARSKATMVESKFKLLELTQKYGKPQKVSMMADPGEVLLHQGGRGDQRYYQVIPVSEALRLFVQKARKEPNFSGSTESVYVTGVSFEIDLERSCPVDFFAVCAATTGLQYPESQVGVGNDGKTILCPFLNEGGQAGLVGANDKSVTALGAAVFEKYPKDRTAFGASTVSKGLPSGNYEVRNKNIKGVHQGKAEFSLNHVPSGQGPTGSYVRDQIHVWWKVEKELPISVMTNGRLSLLMGVRPQCDGFLSLEPPKGSVGSQMYGAVRNAQVTFYIRHGA